MKAGVTPRFCCAWILLHAAVMGFGHVALSTARNFPGMLSAYTTFLALTFLQPVMLGRRAQCGWLFPLLGALAVCVTFVVNWYFPIFLGLFGGVLQVLLMLGPGGGRAVLWPVFSGVAWAGGMLGAWYLVAPALGVSFSLGPGEHPWLVGVVHGFHGFCYGAGTCLALALMRAPTAGETGRLFWDGDCPFCQKWIARLGWVARQGGFDLATLQSDDARHALGLAPGELPHEMKLRLADGRVLGGVDALIAIAKAASSAAPLGWLLGAPGLNTLARRAYRWIAANRYCLGGRCQVRRTRVNRYPLLHLLIAAAVPTVLWLMTDAFSNWARMWLLALGEVFSVKWLMLWRAKLHGSNAPLSRQFAFLFFWHGTDAQRFLNSTPQGNSLSRTSGEWIWAITKIFAGIGFLFGGASIVRSNTIAGSWTGMLGLILLLHFGLVHLISLAWRSAGVDAPLLMRTPLAATSVADFWGARWNLGFAVPARELIFRPLARPLGITAATIAVFFVSGILHETVISLPAGGGWGMPTGYFLWQGLAVLFERSFVGAQLGLGRGARGWLFMATCTAGPAYWLFHHRFAEHVVIPMLANLNSSK